MPTRDPHPHAILPTSTSYDQAHPPPIGAFTTTWNPATPVCDPSTPVRNALHPFVTLYACLRHSTPICNALRLFAMLYARLQPLYTPHLSIPPTHEPFTPRYFLQPYGTRQALHPFLPARYLTVSYHILQYAGCLSVTLGDTSCRSWIYLDRCRFHI
jgi:hypothetical protein